jgi:hypothetical protein
MGRQPRSGDIPWLSAHSILNWIGGDTHYANPVWLEVKGYVQKSAICAHQNMKSRITLVFTIVHSHPEDFSRGFPKR